VTQPGGKWQLNNDDWNEDGEPDAVPVTDEIGKQIGVLFAPDGTMVTRNLQGAGGSGAVVWPYLDGDRDGVPVVINHNGYGGATRYTAYDAVGDEVDCHPVQWLAVYDDEALRNARGDSNWGGINGEVIRNSMVTAWVEQFGVPIFFNRYTGVAEVSKP
jgi:hypothetical protein